MVCIGRHSLQRVLEGNPPCQVTKGLMLAPDQCTRPFNRGVFPPKVMNTHLKAARVSRRAAGRRLRFLLGWSAAMPRQLASCRPARLRGGKGAGGGGGG